MKESQRCKFNSSPHPLEGGKAPKHIRCPKCNRRLKPRMYNHHHYFGGTPDWSWSIPPHKVKKWWKIAK